MKSPWTFISVLLFVAFAAKPLEAKPKKEEPIGIDRYTSAATRLEFEKQLEKLSKRHAEHPQEDLSQLQSQFWGAPVGENILRSANFDKPNGISEAKPKFLPGFEFTTKTGEVDLEVDHHFLNSEWDYSVVRYVFDNGIVTAAYRLTPPAVKTQIYSNQVKDQALVNRNLAAIHDERLKYCALENGGNSLLDGFKEISKNNIPRSFQDNVTGNFDRLKQKFADSIKNNKTLNLPPDANVSDYVSHYDNQTTKGVFLTFGSRPYTRHLIKVDIPDYPTVYFDGKHFLTAGTRLDESGAAKVFINGDTIQCDKGDLKKIKSRVDDLTSGNPEPLTGSGEK